MIQTVKLGKLHLSDINVRKTGDAFIEQLAADILARGVLQNLLITPARKPRSSFAVFAGGRRFRALSLLVERGDIVADDYDVPVKILKGDAATLTETSLAENFQKLAMTPADECRAFQHFLGQDGDIDAVAKRFGITRRFIEGRLRLASLAEPIFGALSGGEITLDLAKAYASTDSQDKQLLIYNMYRNHSYINADTIRRAIANETMKANDAVALLVGEDAYVAAGGKVDRDLFSDAGDRWTNPEIAQRLAAETMEAEAKRVGEELGLAWIRPIATSQTYNAAAGLYRVNLPHVPLDEDQKARIDAIDTRGDAISCEMEDEALSQDAYDALEAEASALSDERDAILTRERVLTDELKPMIGTFLTLTHKGEMVLADEYYSETPLRPVGTEVEGGAGATGGTTFDDGGRVAGVLTPALRPESVAPGGKPLSAKLYDELAMDRRDVLAACLLAQPALALDYALFAMVDGNRSHAQYGTTIQARNPQDPVLGERPASRARTYVANAFEGLDSGWTEPQSEVDRFEAFRGLDDDSKAGWLAYVVATSLQAKSGYSAGQNALQNRLASIMEVDVASWWRPTSENFFDRVNKGALLTLLNEVGGPNLSSRYAASKKTEISASCQKLFAGEAIVEAEVKELALTWVPNAMRFLDDASGEDADMLDEDREDDGDDAIDLGDDKECVDEPDGTPGPEQDDDATAFGEAVAA